MSANTPQAIRTASAMRLALSPDEYRLALLGVVDFEGNWDALMAATALVVDGPAKARLIRERLASASEQVSVLFAEDIDVLELLAARHWFAMQACQRSTRSKHVDKQGEVGGSLDGDDVGAGEGRA